MTKKIKTKSDVMRIKVMRIAGYTTQEIADHFGVQPRAIFYWVNRMKAEGIDAPTSVKRGTRAVKL